MREPSLGLPRKQLAHVQARHVGRDRAEWAAIFGRRQRLQIVRLQMAWAAPHPEQDHRRVARGLASAGPRREQLIETHTSQAEHAGSQEFAAAQRTRAGKVHRTIFAECVGAGGLFGRQQLIGSDNSPPRVELGRLSGFLCRRHCGALAWSGQLFCGTASMYARIVGFSTGRT